MLVTKKTSDTEKVSAVVAACSKQAVDLALHSSFREPILGMPNGFWVVSQWPRKHPQDQHLPSQGLLVLLGEVLVLVRGGPGVSSMQHTAGKRPGGRKCVIVRG